MVFQDLNSSEESLGTSELLFEVVSGGSADGLHSKSDEVLRSVLALPDIRTSMRARLAVEYLYLKMLNNIDTQQTLVVYEIVTECLTDAETIPLLYKILNDAIRLKYGKRVSKNLEQFLLKTLTNQMKKVDQPKAVQCLVAETLSLLFYFKH
jgi:hypothetical protein